MADYHGLSAKGNENLWGPLRGLFERARSATRQGTFGSMTPSLSDSFAGGVASETRQSTGQDNFFDQDVYRAFAGEGSMQDSEQDNSIWNLNNYTVQHTFDPTWWSDVELGPTTATE
jgi:hypothetical protein